MGQNQERTSMNVVMDIRFVESVENYKVRHLVVLSC